MSAHCAVETLITRHKVALFVKSWCPRTFFSDLEFTDGAYEAFNPSDSAKARAVFRSLNTPDVGLIELDLDAKGDSIQQYLAEKTGQRTVPNIFINGNHIGGNDRLQVLFCEWRAAALDCFRLRGVRSFLLCDQSNCSFTVACGM